MCEGRGYGTIGDTKPRWVNLVRHRGRKDDRGGLRAETLNISEEEEDNIDWYLNINELHECKAKTGHRDFVLDKDDSLHAFRAFFANS